MRQRLLEGDVGEVIDAEVTAEMDDREALEGLHAEVKALRRRVDEAESKARHCEAAMIELRRQLRPLYAALCGVFEVIEDVAPDRPGAATPTNGMSDRVKEIWSKWRERMPGYPARIIDALLLHGDMNTQQLAIVVGCHKQRISEGIMKLNKAGLINKNAGRFSLKQL